MATVTGKGREMRRVRGGYEIDVDIAETRKNRTTPGQKLRACLDRSDPAAWNRWVQDISGSLELMGMNLKHVDLSGYDLCCADFTGSDFTGANLGGAVLSGADLRKCVLDQVNVAGADLFRARLDRAHAPLVRLSGMPEVESVILSEE